MASSHAITTGQRSRRSNVGSRLSGVRCLRRFDGVSRPSAAVRPSAAPVFLCWISHTSSAGSHTRMEPYAPVTFADLASGCAPRCKHSGPFTCGDGWHGPELWLRGQCRRRRAARVPSRELLLSLQRKTPRSLRLLVGQTAVSIVKRSTSAFETFPEGPLRRPESFISRTAALQAALRGESLSRVRGTG